MKNSLVYISAFLLVLLGQTALLAGPGDDSLAQDSEVSPADEIKNIVAYDRYYPFINYGDNYIEWDDYSAIASFFKALGQADKRQVKVVHIGDSHVQADWITGNIRERYQQHFGLGGRGSVFPYAAAKTHSAYDYVTYESGDWFYSRNVMRDPAYDLGMSGTTVATADAGASFKFVFVDGYLRPSSTRLRIFCNRSEDSYDLKLLIGQNDTISIDIYEAKTVGKSGPMASDTQMLVVDLPRVSDTLHFYTKKNEKGQERFELYGISLENPADQGVLYHSVGVNGAGYKAVMRQNLLYDQVKMVDPDLVVIDFGANDFKYRYYNKSSLKQDLETIIDSVRAAVPEASIMVTNVQDAYQRGRNLVECQYFAVHTRQVALRKNCAYYDYYHVSGERYSMQQWRRYGLAKRDRVHLKPDGYRVKGELYFNAMMNSYAAALEKEQPEKLLVKSAKPEKKSKPIFRNKPAAVAKEKTKNKIYYKIRYGDNLSLIADRHGVKVSQLMDWNNLHDNKIYPGKTLIVYLKNPPEKTVKPKPNKTIPTPTGDKLVYRVRAGDNLSVIAQKFRVSLSQIKAWNKLTSDRIDMGQSLTIYPGDANESDTPEKAAKTDGMYIVKPGDSLWKISQRLDISVEELMRINKLEGEELKAGQQLKIKP